MNTSIQKIIKIGSSAGVTIPSKELKRAGLKVGDYITISFTQVSDNVEVIDDQEVLKRARDILKKYDKDFKNLVKK